MSGKPTSYVCTKCRVEKPLTDFHKHHGQSLGIRKVCKVCRREHEAAGTLANANERRLHSFPDRHPERAWPRQCYTCGKKFLARRRGGTLQLTCSERCKVSRDNRLRRRRNPEYLRQKYNEWCLRRDAEWREYISKQRCATCGENHPATLDHHHLDPTQKRFTVGAYRSRPWPTLLKEIAKCVVLCANCHRKLEYDKRQEKKRRIA
jgi:hypothetical protein